MAFNLSGGFAAGQGADALMEMLVQARRDQLAREGLRQEQQRINQQGERDRLQAEIHKAQLADAATARKEVAADRLASDLGIGQELSPETVGTLTAGNRGDLIKAPTLGSTNIGGDLMRGQLRMEANPGKGPTYLGTAGQQGAERARQDRLAQFEQARQDKIAAGDKERQAKIDAAAAAQQGREDLARLTASLHGSNADLQRQLLQDKVDANHQKAADQQKAVDTARNAALASIDDTSSALDELLDPQGNLKPGVGGAVGWDALRSKIPGTAAADAKARIDRLQSRLTVDLLGEMKRQSRTGASGFGALSEKELAVLQNAAARLSASQSDESFRQALGDVRKQLAGMRQRAAGGVTPAPPAGGAAPAAAPKRVRYDMNGNPIKD